MPHAAPDSNDACLLLRGVRDRYFPAVLLDVLDFALRLYVKPARQTGGWDLYSPRQVPEIAAALAQVAARIGEN